MNIDPGGSDRVVRRTTATVERELGWRAGGSAGDTVGTPAEAADEEAATNGDRPLSIPGSLGTGPVDPAVAYTREDLRPIRRPLDERRLLRP